MLTNGDDIRPMASSSASSSSCSDDHIDIAERISRARLVLSSLPEELCPPSRPTSPQASPRAEDLKQAIMDAVTMANSNPTHPKWGHLTRMVRLHCTRRGYIGAGEGVRIGGVQKADLPSIEWELPETEEDWERYVRRWARKFNSRSRKSKYFQPEAEEDLARAPARKAEIVREKVTTWQANVVPMEGLVLPQDEVSISAQGKSSTSTTAVDKGNAKGTDSQGLLSQSSLGFAVIKRSTIATKKQGKGNDQDPFTPADVPHPPKSPSDVRMSSSLPQSVAPAPVADTHHPTPSSSEPKAVIAEVSEMSFLPPSFPSQLRTSTPPIDKAKAKPPPIMPSSPISSPPPTQHITIPGLGSPFTTQARKRSRADSPRHSDAMNISDEHPDCPPTKKARIAAPDSSSSAPIPPTSTPPPPTSSASNGDAGPVRTFGLGNAAGLPIDLPATPERQALPTLTELLASSRRSKARPRPPSRKTKSVHQTPQKNDGIPAADADVDMERESSPARTFFSSPASGSSSSSPRFNARPPVSPLFSQNPGAFAPAFVSSQPGGFLGYGSTQAPFHGGIPISRAGSGMFGLGFNSQFDVEGGINRAAELLDKDVDYADWLRDIPEAEDEAGSLKQSQGEVVA